MSGLYLDAGALSALNIPLLGNVLLCCVLVCAAYSMAVSIAAHRGRLHLLPSARASAFASMFLLTAGVFVLAYAFQAHDFRIRYVARYSDRSMPWYYLWTALWGGQDGSLLWWSFLLCIYSGLFLWRLKNKHRELQPVAIATLMSTLIFFCVLMLFAANPFSTGFAKPPMDGEGLNPLLQNYWMAIHPPALYMGLTGWAVPFAIVVSALVTGRLSEEWILLARRWVLLAWGFLTLGNLLGMFWSYEELGWGGYWAWDPVENASFMPWLTGTAYLHSVMVQERRGMLKIWNVSLLSATFLLTIFGTFLTRSGLIASVHSFARSDIGIYFVWYMVIAFAFLVFWIVKRLPLLRSEGTIESKLSREYFYVLNNWTLTFMFFFVIIATTFPLISEALRGETVTVGPGFYNRWMIPLGFVLMALMGTGPLIAWRKATGKNLRNAFVLPLIAGGVAATLHLSLGKWLGFPAIVASETIYETTTGQVLALMGSTAPLVSFSLSMFVIAAVLQEFHRGAMARVNAKSKQSGKENYFTALYQVVARGRRRYGGYMVHLGVVLLYLGFTGAAYDQEREGAMRPGQTLEVAGYTFRYERPRMENDGSKRMIFADVTVIHKNQNLGLISPGKFIYRSHPEMPTTEVAIRTTWKNDLYVILSTVDADTRRATIRVIVRPLVFWIWFGGAFALLGTFVSAFPSVKELLGEETGNKTKKRLQGSLPQMANLPLLLLALSAALSLGLIASPSVHAQSDGTSSLHAGTVEIHDPTEKKLFERTLCQCGDCQRLPLSTCGCSWAENMRAELRTQLAAGVNLEQLTENYRARFGSQGISIPSDRGLDRALWAVPIAGGVVALGALLLAARKWQGRNVAQLAQGQAAVADAELDDRLNRELSKIDE